MSFFCRLSRRHYWCTPHRSTDGRLVQVCYECGSERPARELQDDFAYERYNHSLATARSEATKLSARLGGEMSGQTLARQDRIAVGQNRTTKFFLIK